MELHFLNMREVTPEQLREWEQMMAAERRQRCRGLSEKRRRELICGDALARRMLAERMNTEPQVLQFTYGESGKPLCQGAWFSVSHSDEMLLCAVSDRPVGADIERLRPVPETLLRILSQEERDFAIRGDFSQHFLRLWTMKEAWIKCHGGHLGEFRRAALSVKNEEIQYSDRSMKLTVPRCPEGYVAAICEREKTE